MTEVMKWEDQMCWTWKPTADLLMLMLLAIHFSNPQQSSSMTRNVLHVMITIMMSARFLNFLAIYAQLPTNIIATFWPMRWKFMEGRRKKEAEGRSFYEIISLYLCYCGIFTGRCANVCWFVVFPWASSFEQWILDLLLILELVANNHQTSCLDMIFNLVCISLQLFAGRGVFPCKYFCCIILSHF